MSAATPILVLNPDRAARFKQASGKVDMYHGRKGEEERIVEKTTSIEQFAEADQTLARFTTDRIKSLAQGNKPFFIAHNFMRVLKFNAPGVGRVHGHRDLRRRCGPGLTRVAPLR